MEGDIEDLLGKELYVQLINAAYALDPPLKMEALKEGKGPGQRLVIQVEDVFKTMPPNVAEFDHYDPATWLIQHPEVLAANNQGTEGALDRFEKIFRALNGLLS